MGFFSDMGSAFRSIGEKTLKGAEWIGKKAGKGLDYTIQGLKYVTDKADKYTLGLDHFIPYYTALKAGIDVADRFRKIAKGEEKFGWGTVLETGLDVGFGAMSAYGGKQELEGLKGGWKMFKGARATGSGMKEAIKMGGGRALRGYGIHKEQLKQMGKEGFRGSVNIAKAMRRGEPSAWIKAGAGVGAVAGGAEVYGKAQQEEDERQPQRQPQRYPQRQPQRQRPRPRVLDPKSQTNKPPPSKPTIVPQPIVHTKTGIYQNGRLVG
jgi:hypothetical protein